MNAIARRSLAVLALAVLAVPVRTEQFQGGSLAGYVAGPLADAEFERAVVAGEFTGDLDLDAFVLDRGEPILLIRPEAFGTALHSGIAATDLALLPRSAGEDRDSVVAAGAAGLTRLRWNGATQELEAAAFGVPGWEGARELRTGQLDGQLGHDVAGLASAAIDDRRVLRALSDGAGGLVAAAAIQTANPAIGLESFDYDGDGADELLVLTAAGLEFYDSDGSLDGLYPTALPPRFACPLRGFTPERVAVFWSLGGAGAQFVSVFSQAGTVGPFALGPQGAFRACAGDLDGDGDDDLVLATKNANAVKVLRGRSADGGSAFDLTAAPIETWSYGDPARAPAWLNAGPALGDFDHDGDVDALAPVQGDWPDGAPGVYSDVAVVQNGAIDRSARSPTLAVNVVHGAPASGLPFTFDFEFAAAAVPLGVPDGCARKLEVAVWRTPQLGQPTEGLAAVGSTLLAPPAGGAAPAHTAFSFTVPTNFLFSHELYSITVREVAVAEDGAAVAVGPALIASHAGYLALQGVQALEDAIATVPTAVDLDGGDSVPGGGMVILPRVPGMDDDDAPRDPAP